MHHSLVLLGVKGSVYLGRQQVETIAGQLGQKLIADWTRCRIRILDEPGIACIENCNEIANKAR